MSWVIEIDHIVESEAWSAVGVNRSAVGIRGYGVFPITADTEGAERFKLFDDDGVLYYEGWLIDDDECPWFESAWESAWNWASNDSGCTAITDANEHHIIS